jgi:non-ribosomal peptide synthetase component F
MAEGATLFMVLFAGFQALLHHHTGQDDLAVGTDVAGRDRAELEPLIGFFVNQLVLRTDLSGDPSFRDLVRRTRQVALDAYAHQELPFDLLVQHLLPARDPGHSPFFQAKLFLIHDDTTGAECPGLTIRSREVETGAARLDLTVGLWDTPRGIHGWINYRTALFEGSTIERLARELQTILERAAERPEARLSELLPAPARHPPRFRRVQPRSVSLAAAALTTRSVLGPGRGLPLVIQPAAEALDLAEWTAANRDDLAAELARHGAILFRGFGIDSAAAFERFAHAACPDLLAHNPEHDPLSADGKIQTPVHYAPYRKLLWHNENSFQRRWPTKIMFACQQPADRGGETPLVDSREVFRRIPSRTHRMFGERKIMYVRTLGAGVGLDNNLCMFPPMNVGRRSRTTTPTDPQQKYP